MLNNMFNTVKQKVKHVSSRSGDAAIGEAQKQIRGSGEKGCQIKKRLFKTSLGYVTLEWPAPA
jgi:hypothetical protein